MFPNYHQMKTKLDTLKEAAARNDWRKAIAIAAKFPRLGAYKADIERAHMAYTYPHFLEQTGRDVEDCKAQGRAALIKSYKLTA